ncbi:MAG: porin family protein, partial [Ferruginibacter sp.]
MKKLVIALFIMAGIFSTATAQKVYIQGGANLANITKDADGNTDDQKSLVSFNVGVMGSFGLSDILDIETGLLFTGRGQKFESVVNDNNYVKGKFNPLFIELPVNLLVKFPVTKTSHLFVNAGPYVAVGVAGKSKVETKFLGVVANAESNIEFNNDDPTTAQQEDASYSKIKRFDYGLNFGGGVAFKSLIIKANYGLGLA